VVDLQVATFHPMAKRAKDAAAGAVLVLAATSATSWPGVLIRNVSASFKILSMVTDVVVLINVT
jgi:diacylglycerol kinase